MPNSFGHFDCTVRFKPDGHVLLENGETLQIDREGGIPTQYRVLNKAGFVRHRGWMVAEDDSSPNTRPERP